MIKKTKGTGGQVAPSAPNITIGKKPKLCFIALHSCTRMAKEACALLKEGYEVHLVTTKIPVEQRWFDSIHVHTHEKQLFNALQQVNADIYQVHNEPTWLVTKTRKMIGNKPLVFDAHDWELLRCNADKAEDLPPWKVENLAVEAHAVNMSDAIVYISDPIQKFMNKRYNFKKPTTVIESWCNEQFTKTPEVMPKKGDVIYQGGLSGNGGGEEWRNYIPIAKAFVDQKIDFHFLGFFQNDKQRKMYEDTGATLHMPVPRPLLIKELAAYKWGIFGTLDKSKNMKWCLPNKLFEYTAAGIPTIAVGYVEEVKKFIRKYKVGIVIDDLNKIELPDPREFKKAIWDLRPHLTMEKQIYKLEELYAQIV